MKPALAQGMKLSLRWHLRALGLRATLVAAGFAAWSTTGCLSNEYTITKDELVRVVQLPPGARGERVRVLQDLGERQGEPVPPRAPPAPWVGPPLPADSPPVMVIEDQPSIYIDGGFDFPVHRAAPVRTGSVTRSVMPTRAGGWRAPSANPGGSGSGGVMGKAGGAVLKGGGGGKGEEVAVLAVVMAVVAVFAVVGLAVSEGARFDGYTEMRPEQPIHLKNARGQELHVALGALTAEDVAVATLATVRDNEGYGLRLLDRRPLDRVGPTFKVTVGGLMEPPAVDDPRQEWGSGLASTIQLGGFVTQGFGVLASVSLGGGSDAAGRTFQRHGLSVEAQAFPLRAGPLSVGAFGHGGVALAGNSDTGLLTGPALGGGLMLELAMSTRLAFAVRGGMTATNIDGWVGSGSITAGLSIY